MSKVRYKINSERSKGIILKLVLLTVFMVILCIAISVYEKLTWDPVQTVNLLIAAILGLWLSYLTAYFYERFRNTSLEERIESYLRVYESKNNEFDWQRWDIIDGVISNSPTSSSMQMEYVSGYTFNFYLREFNDIDPTITSHGRIVFDDVTRGRLFYSENIRTSFGVRNFICYHKHKHNELDYHAIFVKADDESQNYVMLKPYNSDNLIYTNESKEDLNDDYRYSESKVL